MLSLHIKFKKVSSDEIEPDNLCKILFPPIHIISRSGTYTIEKVLMVVQDAMRGRNDDLKMYHQWPFREPRATTDKLLGEIGLLTGESVLDAIFP